MSKKKAKPEDNQIHCTAVRGGVVLTVGPTRVFLASSQADDLGMELIRKGDVARLIARLAASGRVDQ